MAATSASTTIRFAIVQPDGAGGSSSISVELDDDANGGKTTFMPGDTANFLVHTKPADLSVSVDTTMGTVVENGTKSVEVVDQISFVKSKSQSLSRVPNGTVTTSWVGRSGGAPVVTDSTVTLPAEANGVLACTYSTTAKAYKLSGVTIPTGMEEIQVLVVVSAATT